MQCHCVNLVGSQSLLAGHTVIHVHCILLLLFYGTMSCTHQIVLTQHLPKGYQSWTGPVPSLVVGGTSHHEPSTQPACRAIGHHASLGPAPGPEASPWVSPWASPSWLGQPLGQLAASHSAPGRDVSELLDPPKITHFVLFFSAGLFRQHLNP